MLYKGVGGREDEASDRGSRTESPEVDLAVGGNRRAMTGETID